MVYVVSGRTEIRWGDRLKFTADVGAGDFCKRGYERAGF